MKIWRLLWALTCFITASSQAATITFDPNPETVTLGSTFTLDIIGTDFPETEGGGAEFTFDSTVLQVNSVSIDSGVWGIFESSGTIDNTTGKVEGITVATFTDPGASFIVASIEFQAIGLGSTDLILSENPLNLWASGGNTINPALINGAVTIVPIPAAFYLFGTGLLGLIGFSCRKK